jgi:hypothetical protein
VAPCLLVDFGCARCASLRLRLLEEEGKACFEPM